MGFGMREVETPAQRVAEFMMQTHAHRAETGSTKPGAILGFEAGFEIGLVVDDDGQGFGERLCAFEGEHVDDWVCVSGVECFH